MPKLNWVSIDIIKISKILNSKVKNDLLYHIMEEENEVKCKKQEKDIWGWELFLFLITYIKF